MMMLVGQTIVWVEHSYASNSTCACEIMVVSELNNFLSLLPLERLFVYD